MPGARRRILVIEDDPETAEQLVDELSSHGYEVDLALNGNDGFERGRSADYAVMTIDRMGFPMSHRSYRWKEHLEAGALLSRTASDLKAAVDLPDERLHHP